MQQANMHICVPMDISAQAADAFHHCFDRQLKSSFQLDVIVPRLINHSALQTLFLSCSHPLD